MPNGKKVQIKINFKPEIFVASATLITSNPKGIEITMVSGNSGQRYFFDWEHAMKFFASLEHHIQKLKKVPAPKNPVV
ncbi:unnamed protein product [marine sediment metagenome]|uniref:Uncharacterized protein n=1 Tax=marine sediment metagenome TaxID=412755 RepID=X0SAP7_9ZZZZ